jgi:23S rRNA (uracil1939-C5)-methyltransferase
MVPFTTGADATAVRVDLPSELKVRLGEDALLYQAATASYHVSAGSFFQTNRFLIDQMAALATEGRSGGFALDLYSGVGLFSLPLSQNFLQVAAVESATFSFHGLLANAPANVKGYRIPVDKFLASVPRKTHFDYIIADPPRSGMGGKVAKLVAGLKAPQLTYVSCDPATLARDLHVLTAAGYRIREMHLVDMFPQTFHIETVTMLER